MSDDGMDLCECVWGHEMAMRRLLSLLRQSQSYCTDSDCVDPLRGLPGPSNSDNTNIWFIGLIIAFALFMYALRPSSIRNNGDSKPQNNGFPPNPPSTAT